MEPNKPKFKYTVLIVPVAITNGIFSGIVSVITAYFFKPIWDKIMRWWNK